ncbi:helix-turn-helix domain-containing protein [Yinghuangia seranimata]|uniref:helix-turn-helix domain-containing protein n=1 Tax=Yinghuangia seranimata TaxID=408067 RepID=UPI00248C7483|nr:GAF domain-containing protein [Yinghuangia seranimata]MDI2125532.1 helix-turn-helix domain-containing protein [Yinghuangia seranimata]
MAQQHPGPPGPTARFMHRLLELLAEDAPADDFRALAAQARAAGAGPEALAELDSATADALRIRGTLRQHRRRERELTALFDTAGDLAALRDLDSVLRSIVRRARMLLGTDTAYLTLPDEEAGDTYMRVTEGSISPIFQGLRLGLGVGLGGLVAQTARPYATPDYRTDTRFRHVDEIDAGVLDEGLVAILGVPLLLGSTRGDGGKVVGVLMAADRSPRAFSSDEVALMSSLATHAAIAIDTARAMADTRAALAELAEANTVIQAHAAAVQRAEEAHDKLTDLVLRGGDLPEVAAAVAALLSAPVAIHDTDGIELTDTAPDMDPAAAERSALVQATEESHALGRAVPRHGTWICAILAGPEALGSLVLHRAELDDPDRRVFERASVVTALLLLLRRSVAETENRVRGELLTDLLTDPDRDPAALSARARRSGIDLDRPHLVLVAGTESAGQERLGARARQFLFACGGVTAQHAGSTVLLLPDDGTPPGDAARRAAVQLEHRVGSPVTVAAAGPAAGTRGIAEAYGEAARCLRALVVLGRSGDGACASELGFLGVVLGNRQDVGHFVGDALGPLLEYDARRGTELVRTLRAYFASGGSLTRAKDELHIHVNTVVQRLDRIEALLGAGWNEPQRGLELQVALRLLEVSERGAEAGG